MMDQENQSKRGKTECERYEQCSANATPAAAACSPTFCQQSYGCNHAPFVVFCCMAQLMSLHLSPILWEHPHGLGRCLAGAKWRRRACKALYAHHMDIMTSEACLPLLFPCRQHLRCLAGGCNVVGLYGFHPLPPPLWGLYQNRMLWLTCWRRKGFELC